MFLWGYMMKGRTRLLAGFLLTLLVAAPASAPPGCTAQPGYHCGKLCGYNYICEGLAQVDYMCVEIPGGCGGMVNSECCPP